MSSVKVGTIRKGEDKNGELQLRLVLGKGITIMKDGAPVPIDEKFKTLYLFDSTTGVDNLLKSGRIDAEEATNRKEYIGEKNISKDIVAFINE